MQGETPRLRFASLGVTTVLQNVIYGAFRGGSVRTHLETASCARLPFAVDFGMAFPLSRPARLAVFVSGRGSNLRALREAFPPGHPLASVHLVVSNQAEAGALTYAQDEGILAHFVPFGKNREGFERAAAGLIEGETVDLICLAGFMRVLSPEFVGRYAGRILNVHPSLLPRFPGLEPQQRALDAGVNESGCTVHFVDAGVDTGQIIVQRRVPVHPEDDVQTLSARILAAEHLAYPEAVRLVLEGKAVMDTPQGASQDAKVDGKVER